MRRLDIDDANSCEELACTIYERIQQVTCGKARRAARFLAAITCLELDGVILPSSPWCLLILFSLQDLSTLAPGEVLVIDDWAYHRKRLMRQLGDADFGQVAGTLVWAARLHGNIELRAPRNAVVRMRTPVLSAAHDLHPALCTP